MRKCLITIFVVTESNVKLTIDWVFKAITLTPTIFYGLFMHNIGIALKIANDKVRKKEGKRGEERKREIEGESDIRREVEEIERERQEKERKNYVRKRKRENEKEWD